MLRGREIRFLEFLSKGIDKLIPESEFRLAEKPKLAEIIANAASNEKIVEEAYQEFISAEKGIKLDDSQRFILIMELLEKSVEFGNVAAVKVMLKHWNEIDCSVREKTLSQYYDRLKVMFLLAASKGYAKILESIWCHMAEQVRNGSNDVLDLDGLKDINGKNSLMLAAENGHIDAVKFLLLHSADWNVEHLLTKKKALDFARDAGKYQVCDYIETFIKFRESDSLKVLQKDLMQQFQQLKQSKKTSLSESKQSKKTSLSESKQEPLLRIQVAAPKSISSAPIAITEAVESPLSAISVDSVNPSPSHHDASAAMPVVPSAIESPLSEVSTDSERSNSGKTMPVAEPLPVKAVIPKASPVLPSVAVSPNALFKSRTDAFIKGWVNMDKELSEMANGDRKGFLSIC